MSADFLLPANNKALQVTLGTAVSEFNKYLQNRTNRPGYGWRRHLINRNLGHEGHFQVMELLVREPDLLLAYLHVTSLTYVNVCLVTVSIASFKRGVSIKGYGFIKLQYKIHNNRNSN